MLFVRYPRSSHTGFHAQFLQAWLSAVDGSTGRLAPWRALKTSWRASCASFRTMPLLRSNFAASYSMSPSKRIRLLAWSMNHLHVFVCAASCTWRKAHRRRAGL